MGADTERRVAMVTGASRGIGKAIAKRLACDGRRVILVARNEDTLLSVQGEIESAGGSAGVLAVDVGHTDAWREGIEGVIANEGRLDVLVNNAGVTRDNLMLRMSDEEFDDVIRINLKSAFVSMRAASRAMMRQKFGRMVNIGSTSGVVGNPGQANYAASKAGLTGMTRSIARELGGKGITANVIAPGYIQTDMTSSLPDEVKQKVLGAMALRRLGEPEDIAAAVSYVSSDEAGFLSGQVICVDGGLTMS